MDKGSDAQISKNNDPPRHSSIQIIHWVSGPSLCAQGFPGTDAIPHLSLPHPTNIFHILNPTTSLLSKLT